MKVLADQRRKDENPRKAVIMADARKQVMIAGALCKSRQWLSEVSVRHAAAFHRIAGLFRKTGARSNIFSQIGEDSQWTFRHEQALARCIGDSVWGQAAIHENHSFSPFSAKATIARLELIELVSSR